MQERLVAVVIRLPSRRARERGGRGGFSTPDWPNHRQTTRESAAAPTQPVRSRLDPAPTRAPRPADLHPEPVADRWVDSPRGAAGPAGLRTRAVVDHLAIRSRRLSPRPAAWPRRPPPDSILFDQTDQPTAQDHSTAGRHHSARPARSASEALPHRDTTCPRSAAPDRPWRTGLPVPPPGDWPAVVFPAHPRRPSTALRSYRRPTRKWARYP